MGFRYFTRERRCNWGCRGMPTTWKMALGGDPGIAGPEQKVQMMLGWLEHGPRTATVT